MENVSAASYLIAAAVLAVWVLLQFLLIRHSNVRSWINFRVAIGLALAVFALINGNYLVMLAGLAFAVFGLFRRVPPSKPPQYPDSNSSAS